MSLDFSKLQFAVTGAASGIGEATAVVLKKLGARVIALDMREPDAHAADDFIEFDQGDEASIANAVARAPARIDGLMNIAGVAPGGDISAARLLSINFFGLRSLTNHFIERLAPNAAVINMSSHAGHRWRENAHTAQEFLAIENFGDLPALVQQRNIQVNGLGDDCAYPLSKQLVNLWTVQSHGQMEKHHLRMNAVSAGGVDTPILRDFLTSFGEKSADRIKSIGVVSPEAVAATIVFLASKDATSIKSAIIPVDNGAAAMAALKAINA